MGLGMMIGAGIGAANGLLNASGVAAAEGAAIDAGRKQKIEIIKSMNWNEAKSRLDIKSQWDQATAELSDMNMAAIRNRTTIAAGISESGMEGRTTRQVQRAVEGGDLRAKSRLTENYERDYQSLLNKKQEEWDAGLSSIVGIQKVRTTNPFSASLGVVSSGLSGAMMGSSLETSIRTPQGAKGK